MNHIDWIAQEIKHVCLTYKRRIAGSDSERACGDYLAKILKKFSDRVDKEDFVLHPKAFIGSFAFQAICKVVTVIFFYASLFLHLPILSAIAVAFALLVAASWVFEYVLYIQCFDFLYPKRISQNIMAVRKAGKETRQRIIICGHSDAAYETPFFLKLKAAPIYVMSIIGILGIFYSLAICLINTFYPLSGTSAIVLGTIEGLLLIADVFFLFFVDWNTVADGANDNLTGCYLGMSILKEMEEKGERLEHTDVCCLITGGEESGLRGSFAYAKKHRQELLDTNTVVIAADTIHSKDQLMIYTRGINFTQKNSKEVCELLRKAGKECGVTLPDTDFYLGATDSEAFSRSGIKAAAICGVHHTPSTYYHTRFDTWNNINKDCIALTRDILKASIRLYDEGLTKRKNEG